jgi:outer membrane protein assembly factor BamE (lipoprotein component of BamABCDE complex)
MTLICLLNLWEAEIMKKPYLLIFCLFFLACATAEHGRTFDTSKAQQIEIGKTTEAEVLTMLGSPYQSQIRPNGEKMFIYSHIQVTAVLVKGIAKTERLSILFDKSGIVKAIDKTGI